MKDDEEIKEAMKCYYYGCAGKRICTFYSWTTHCPYPKCDKEDLLTGEPIYGRLNTKD